MGKIVLLVPREEMLYLAHNILQEKKYSIAHMGVIETDQTVVEARKAIAAGADILIARGLQASLIKQYTAVPVVEITATAQEMALLVVKAKQIIKKERPFIAVVGFRNMFCDMTYFEAIYGIKLKTYFAENGSGLPARAREAVADGADLLIGGDLAVETAKEAGIPSLFLSITEDSLRTAFAMAESLDFAMGAEKRSSAQLETLLDYSFNGVVNLDPSGRITAINPVMRDILELQGEKAAGQPLWQLFPDLDREKLSQILSGREESYSFFMKAGSTSGFAVLAPVRVGEEVTGAILTCHKIRRQDREKKNGDQKKSPRPSGLIARGTFGDISQKSGAMRECLHLARLYAPSEQPVLLIGETGTESRLLAESLHNGGLCSEGPFLALSCSGLSSEEQEEMLFGSKGALFLAQGGTLYLEDIDALSPKNQYGIAQLIRYKTGSSRDFARTMSFHIRVIGSTCLSEEEFRAMAQKGDFRRDLYYLFLGLTLVIPPLRARKEELENLIDREMRTICEQYSRYHVLTQGGRKYLMDSPWHGNRLQLHAVLERLILTAQKRTIDETVIKKLMVSLFGPSELPSTDQTRFAETGMSAVPGECISGSLSEGEALQIRQALSSMGGNRERTANYLGISKATLWRKMKKYGIEI